MTAANLPNPFAQHKVDNTLEVPPGDVPHLHREVLERCLSAINMACDDRQSHAILVIGEAGSGKSHLLASLRARLQNRREVILAGIRLGGTYSGRLWRQVRERLFDELLRPLPPSSDYEHALGRILDTRHADRRISSSPETPDSLPMLARPQTGRNRVNADRLQTLGRCVSIDRRLFRVLEQVLEEGLTPVIRSWLRGETLEEDDWEELGFSPQDQDESDEEIAAEQVIRSILRIAGAGRSAMGHDTVLAICFDEVEGLFAQSDDRSVLKRFAHLATELLAEPGPRVVVSFVRPKLVIPPLRLDEAIDVVRARLQTQRPSTSVNFGNDPLAPIGRRFVEQLHRRHPRSLTPRQLIMACQEEYNRRCSESALAPRLDTSALATSGSNDHDHFAYLNETWESRCQTLSRHVTTLAFDSILGITLPWLVQVEKLPLTLCDELPRPYGDINLIFRQSRRPDL
jgi:energy-coupling factor transporter ATP-binding protein EcfA2